MGTFSLMHWVVVLLIVAIIFGTRRLRNIGEDLGAAVRGFKEGMKEGEQNTQAKSSTPSSPTQSQDHTTPPQT